MTKGFLVKDDILEIQTQTELERRENPNAEPLIVDFDPKLVEAWSVNLRLGAEAYVSSQKRVRQLREGETVRIEPGETALLLTLEKLNMRRNLVAFITLKFSKKRKGLINVSGFHVDPDFKGHLLYSVYNAGPEAVLIRHGEAVFSIYFYQLWKLTEARPEKAQHQNISRIRSEWAEDIAGPAVSLITVNDQLTSLRYRVNGIIWLFGGILLAAAGALLTMLVTGRPS